MREYKRHRDAARTVFRIGSKNYMWVITRRTGGVNLLCDGGTGPIIQNATLACPHQGDEV